MNVLVNIIIKIITNTIIPPLKTPPIELGTTLLNTIKSLKLKWSKITRSTIYTFIIPKITRSTIYAFIITLSIIVIGYFIVIFVICVDPTTLKPLHLSPRSVHKKINYATIMIKFVITNHTTIVNTQQIITATWIKEVVDEEILRYIFKSTDGRVAYKLITSHTYINQTALTSIGGLNDSNKGVKEEKLVLVYNLLINFSVEFSSTP